MLAKTYCAAVVGLEATTITVEVNMTRGVMYNLSGMADTAVKESYARIMAALPNVGYKIPLANLTVNLSSADIRKEGSSYDHTCRPAHRHPRKEGEIQGTCGAMRQCTRGGCGEQP